ncbi:probable polyamine transporter At3g19553 [Syzygium oleosum]|uniref:probable polyamine transporter At3g19553 n=1 Tax=Syzygium oleosum TaxID=219896 RepID=UPI0024B89A0F|nr:probable polyamine transporter At3g19553 [Syzygium oleosum]
MGEEEGMSSDCQKPAKTSPKLTLLPLIALIFYEVSGGPFGVEDSVKSGGGPLLSLLGFLIFPLFWSIPEALVTAELATSFPENGGYVLWISSAFGPFWGFQEGFWKWFSGVMDNALYPVLFLDYLKHSFPIFNRLIARVPTLLGITASLTYLNYRGLHIVGFSAVSLAAFSLLPFAVMGILSIPRIQPAKWVAVDFRKVDWRGYFNSMFWNLNYWDKASTLAGEVENPSKTFPKALFGAVVLVVGSYLIPLLAGTGAVNTPASDWSDGYFAEVGFLIGGAWLRWWIQAAAAMSNMGLFEAEMSSDAFQLLGMSEMGMLPTIFAQRSKYGTPTISILCSATGVVFLSWMTFQEILEFLNFLYSIGMILEFAAFIRLRIKKPDLHRPYRVPLQTFGATMLCVPPTLLLVLVMCLASAKTLLVSGTVILVGLLLYPLVIHAKDKKWVRFEAQEGLPSDDNQVGHFVESKLPQEDTDDATVTLLSESASSKTQQDPSSVVVEEVLKLE